MDIPNNSSNNFSTNKAPIDFWPDPDAVFELKTYLETIGELLLRVEFDAYLADRLIMLGINSNEQINFQSFCEYIAQSVQIASSLEFPGSQQKNMSKLLKTTALFPLGSYAMRHIRRDHLMADFSFVYELKPEVKTKVDDKSLLEWLCNQLISTIKPAGPSKFNMQVTLHNLEGGFENRTACIIVQETNAAIGVRIFASEQTETGTGTYNQDPIIIHIAKMDSLLKASEHFLEYFNTYCALLKYWRRKSELDMVLRPEIIDIVAFDMASNFDIKSKGLGLFYILHVLANHDITARIISRYNDFFYTNFIVEILAILISYFVITLIVIEHGIQGAAKIKMYYLSEKHRGWEI